MIRSQIFQWFPGNGIYMSGTCYTSWRFYNLTFLLLFTGSVALWIVSAFWRLHHLEFQLYRRGQPLQEGLFLQCIRPAVRTGAFLDSVLYRHWSQFTTTLNKSLLNQWYMQFQSHHRHRHNIWFANSRWPSHQCPLGTFARPSHWFPSETVNSWKVDWCLCHVLVSISKT